MEDNTSLTIEYTKQIYGRLAIISVGTLFGIPIGLVGIAFAFNTAPLITTATILLAFLILIKRMATLQIAIITRDPKGPNNEN